MPETPPTFAVGDRVICNPDETPARYHGIVWTVESKARVNVNLRPVAGGRGLRIHPSALLPAPADGTIPPTATVVAHRPPLTLGAVVTVASPRWKGSTGLYVVLRDNGDTARLVLLGGDQDRYWPKVPRGWLTEVDRDAVLAATAGLRTSS
ncbi:hypothetical protein [Krasilnikovia sp. M28-CT-15]|uniref:hypothetical protein n=1 Tax=Krasilnikovia sp. M28-CT-15 TaxID=3373540 RepID=UPI00387663B1